jgi:hypothetical protein
MENPLERVCARMQANNAHERLRRHWSSRCWWVVQRIAYHLERAGFDNLAERWLMVTGPLCDWLAYRQSLFLRQWF